MEFLGLVITYNPIMSNSLEVIQSLHTANIRTVMATGDGLFSAIHAARASHVIPPLDDVIVVQASDLTNSGEVSVSYVGIPNAELKAYVPDILEQGVLVETRRHFAMTGKTFTLLWKKKPGLLRKIIKRGTIFARMEPEMKAQLVTILHDCGWRVAMCGAEANDLAFQSADVATLLSRVERPFADESFVSLNQDIGCVPELIRTGRAALVTTFILFKHLFACSWVLAVSHFILNYVTSGFSRWQLYYMDTILTLIPIFFVGNADIEPVLRRMPPPHKLFEFQPIISLVAFVSLQVTTCIIGLWYLQIQPWYLEGVDKEDTFNNGPYVNAVIFQLTSMSIIYSTLIFSKVITRRKPYFFNVLLLAVLIFSLLYMVYPLDFVNQVFEIKHPPYLGFRLNLLLISLTDLMVCLIGEKWLLGVWLQHLDHASVHPQAEDSDDEDPWPSLDVVPTKRNTTFVSRTAHGISVDLDL